MLARCTVSCQWSVVSGQQSVVSGQRLKQGQFGLVVCVTLLRCYIINDDKVTKFIHLTVTGASRVDINWHLQW